MINKLIPKTSGKIYIDGKDTDDLDPITLRREIGYVIQQIGLFPNMTIEDNICVVPDLLKMDKKKSREKARELMEMVNLESKIFLKTISSRTFRWPAAADRCDPGAGC
jgi:osmoprotectant transport system ATP-binding protein